MFSIVSKKVFENTIDKIEKSFVFDEDFIKFSPSYKEHKKYVFLTFLSSYSPKITNNLDFIKYFYFKFNHQIKYYNKDIEIEPLMLLRVKKLFQNDIIKIADKYKIKLIKGKNFDDVINGIFNSPAIFNGEYAFRLSNLHYGFCMLENQEIQKEWLEDEKWQHVNNLLFIVNKLKFDNNTEKIIQSIMIDLFFELIQIFNKTPLFKINLYNNTNLIFYADHLKLNLKNEYTENTLKELNTIYKQNILNNKTIKQLKDNFLIPKSKESTEKKEKFIQGILKLKNFSS